MMNEWPGKWISATEKVARYRIGVTNDHGILYICGDVRDGEWLHIHDIPSSMENHC